MTVKELATDHPFKEWREDQTRAITECYKASSSFKYIILEGPTGSGKSAVAVELLRKLGKGRILTSQVMLQHQYKSDYDEFALLKGASRYKCPAISPPEINYLTHKYIPPSDWRWVGKTKNCGESAKWMSKGNKTFSRCNECNYSVATDKALNSKYSIMNYHSYYYQNRNRDGAFKETNLVLDEAHNLNNIVTGLYTREFKEFAGFTFSELSKEESYKGNNRKEKIDIIDKDYVEQALEDYLIHVENRIKICGLRSSVEAKLELELLKERKPQVEYQLNNVGKNYFTYSLETSDNTKTFISKPIDARLLINNSFYTDNKTIIFMSATILDREVFCKEVGVSPKNVYHYRMKDVFPADNHEIKFIENPVNMQSRSRIDNIQHVTKSIENILKIHRYEKGIIHAQTYDICEKVYKRLGDRRLTYYRNHSKILREHSSKPGSVILTPSMKEGVNLPGDMSKFQVLLIVPYPVFDLHTENKMKINGKFYQWSAAVNFIQSLGRSIRTETDECKSYLVDSRFYTHIHLIKPKLSNYLLECLPLEMEKVNV